MLEPLFGNKVIEKILFFLLKQDSCYGNQLKVTFEEPLYSFQKALSKLEKGGILVSFSEANTLRYQFNPRYPFLKELKAFLEKAYSFVPEERRARYYEPGSRTRPRRRGKPYELE